MKNKYLVRKVDHIKFTDQDWLDYFNFRIKSYTHIGEPMPFNSINELKDLNVQNITKYGEEIFQVWKNNIENGILVFSTANKEDDKKRFTWLENYMNDDHLEISLLKILFNYFIKYDKKSNFLALYSKNGKNDYVEDFFKAKTGNNAFLYELNVKEAKTEIINRWLEEARTNNQHFKIRFYTKILDELIHEYAEVLTKFFVDAKVTLSNPTWNASEIKDYQKALDLRNEAWYSYFIFNETNDLIAITHVTFSKENPEIVSQGMTGVLKKYRGMGLSKWLKAEMFTKLLKDQPNIKKIKTDTLPENHPSRELSKQMGYIQTGNEKEIFIDRNNIVKFLKTVSS